VIRMAANLPKLCDLLKMAMDDESKATNQYDLMLDCLPLPGEANYDKPEVGLAYFYLEPIAEQERQHDEAVSRLYDLLCK